MAPNQGPKAGAMKVGGAEDSCVAARAVVMLLLAGLLAFEPPARAQPPARAVRIGYLALVAPAAQAAAIWGAFVRRLAELGWVEGRNVRFDTRYADGNPERFPPLAQELVRLKVDVIVVSGVSPGLAAMQATATIPIVMAGASDPVGFGLVKSLAHPGGNVTGLSDSPGREIEGKRLELLKDVVPGLRRVALVLDSTSRRDPAPIQRAATALGIDLVVSPETAEAEAFRATFRALARQQVGAVYAPETPINGRHRDLIVALAAEHRLPAVYGAREFVDAGGLMSYGTSLTHLYQQAAAYVDRILRGERPGNMPVEQPTRFELALNLKTAAALKLAIPPAVLVKVEYLVK